MPSINFSFIRTRFERLFFVDSEALCKVISFGNEKNGNELQPKMSCKETKHGN